MRITPTKVEDGALPKVDDYGLKVSIDAPHTQAVKKRNVFTSPS